MMLTSEEIVRSGRLDQWAAETLSYALTVSDKCGRPVVVGHAEFCGELVKKLWEEIDVRLQVTEGADTRAMSFVASVLVTSLIIVDGGKTVQPPAEGR